MLNSLVLVFAEWVGENHFHLYNIQDGVHYWKSEEECLTTEELWKRFITSSREERADSPFFKQNNLETPWEDQDLN
jgi:hypothetical protein